MARQAIKKTAANDDDRHEPVEHVAKQPTVAICAAVNRRRRRPGGVDTDKHRAVGLSGKSAAAAAAAAAG